MLRTQGNESAVEPTTTSSDTRPRGRGLGPFSGGQLTAIVIAAVIAVGFPIGAFATTTFSNVAITDPHGTYRATVNASHQLEVHSNTSSTPGHSFSLAANNSGGDFTVKLPGCSTTTCHFAITDVVLSQSNSAVTRVVVLMRLYADGGGGTCASLGPKIKDVLPYEFLPAEQTTTINFTTPVVAVGNPVCMNFVTGSNSGLIFSYTVNGFAQPG